MIDTLSYKADWLEALDGRTSTAQELRRRQAELIADLGGVEILSYQQKSLINRAIFMELHLQQQEVMLANGQTFDSGKWVQACNTFLGLLNKLGLDKPEQDHSEAFYKLMQERTA
jgi:F0F1-type ATP synthase beta subunit